MLACDDRARAVARRDRGTLVGRHDLDELDVAACRQRTGEPDGIATDTGPRGHAAVEQYAHQVRSILWREIDPFILTATGGESVIKRRPHTFRRVGPRELRSPSAAKPAQALALFVVTE